MHKTIDVKNCYKYLGLVMNKNLKWSGNIEFLTTKANSRSNKLLSTLKRLRRLSKEAKLSIWMALVRPVLESGSELWWANKLESQKIESIQLKALKSILGVSSKTNRCSS